MPSKLVMKVKSSIEARKIIVPTIDEKDPNTAVEVYFQFAKDDNSESALQQRVLVDLLEHIIDEPMYNTIRTREQFGYEVSCGSRWTYGVLGMSFRVVTSIKSAVSSSCRCKDVSLALCISCTTDINIPTLSYRSQLVTESMSFSNHSELSLNLWMMKHTCNI